jgi:hypothetical protein
MTFIACGVRVSSVVENANYLSRESLYDAGKLILTWYSGLGVPISFCPFKSDLVSIWIISSQLELSVKCEVTCQNTHFSSSDLFT